MATASPSPTSPALSFNEEKTHASDTTVQPEVVAPEKDQQESQDDEYLHGFKLILVLSSLIMVFFLMLLDTSIIATAIPRITDEFNSLPDVGWYGAAYQLASGALQPLTGKFYQHFNSKWTFLICFLIFELGSLICALANSSMMLIIGRAVAGIGGAGLQNGSITILSSAVTLHKRPMYLGLMMGISQLGVALGPVIGGALTSYTTWRWCFWINLPIGGVVTIFIVAISIPDNIPKDPFKQTIKTVWPKLDLIGFAIFAPFAIMLLLALHYGGVQYPWNSATVIGLFVGAGVSLLLFIAWEYRMGEKAMIPLPMLAQRVVWSSTMMMMFIGSILFIGSYYLPIYFQSVLGKSPIDSGVAVLPNIISQMIFAVLSGALVSKLGYYLPWSFAGSILMSVGCGLISMFSPTTPIAEWIGYQIPLGAGRGMSLQMPMVAVQNTVSQKEMPIAMSMLMFAMTFGSAISLTISNTIFNNGLTAQVRVYAPNVDPALVINTGATDIRTAIPPESLAGVIAAYAVAFDHVFYLNVAYAVTSFFFAFGLGWKDIRQKKAVGPA